MFRSLVDTCVLKTYQSDPPSEVRARLLKAYGVNKETYSGCLDFLTYLLGLPTPQTDVS